MKFLFWTYSYDKSITKQVGIANKILAQIDAFERKGFEVFWTGFNTKSQFIIENRNGIYATYPNNIFIQYTTNFYHVKNVIEKEKIDFLYIRAQLFVNPFFLFILHQIRKINPQIKILYEIPTYPYDGENPFAISKKHFLFLIEKIFRRYLHFYIDRIVTFSQDDFIFNTPCIKISNGIDLKKINIIHKKEHSGIHFCTVATIGNWHGIDRFIKSLLHYKISDLKFFIVGGGNPIVISNLQALIAKDNYLKDTVIFCGIKTGKELETIYNLTDIAVSSLGIHRIGLKAVQSLKNREYTAKGLPFIIGFTDHDFINSKFIYQVPSDESLLNLPAILTWYANLQCKPEDIAKEAHRFSWDKQIDKILKEIGY